jgi:signal transduction histidine kinase
VTVRAKIALTIFVTGLLTAIGVVAAVLLALQRFEHESAYYRADAFLKRVVTQHTDLLALRERFGDDFNGFLRNLVLYEPDTQLYLLAPDGTVLTSTGNAQLPAGFKVRMAPVMEAAGDEPMPYVMGDDPEHMDASVVIAARPLRRQSIAPGGPPAGYLYLVCRPRVFTDGRWAALTSTLSQPALLLMLAVVAAATLLAAWVTAAVTRPLARLTASVGAVTREGLEGLASGTAGGAAPALALPDPADGRFALQDAQARDEFGLLARGIGAMLQTLRTQWATLRRLDHFRREGVSNLSHDLRSPLTATTACLETLDNRWAGDATRDADRQLVEVALRNTRNAARLVQSLGDLARLDEPEFKLKAQVLDVSELLDDVAMRFAERARQQGVHLATPESPGRASTPALASVDVELIERAVANLVDNALKFCAPGATITLGAGTQMTPEGKAVTLCVRDSGAGIAAADLPHLFDRFYQSRQSVAPATGDGGKGLGLAIVKRIAELHGGTVRVDSTTGQGTEVTIVLPAA